jgi:hypothetical protein
MVVHNKDKSTEILCCVRSDARNSLSSREGPVRVENSGSVTITEFN